MSLADAEDVFLETKRWLWLCVKERWERQLAADPEGATRERRETLRKAGEVVCDRLGAATLAKWCEDFPRRFHFS